MIIQESMTLKRKLEILSDAAKYDVACTSSGVDRKGDGKGMGNSIAAGFVKHTPCSAGIGAQSFQMRDFSAVWSFAALILQDWANP